jgi:hypothetical protein
MKSRAPDFLYLYMQKRPFAREKSLRNLKLRNCRAPIAEIPACRAGI